MQVPTSLYYSNQALPCPQFPYFQQNQLVQPPLGATYHFNQGTSQYSQFYHNIQEVLYYEQGDGEIFIFYDAYQNQYTMVTCIDISTLYKEKRGKAIEAAKLLCSLHHTNLINVYRYYIYEERLIYVEMEVPLNLTTWKTFCKKKFSPEEIFSVFKQVTQGIEFLHQQNIIHRDIHPSRIQCFQGNVIKFNHIGLPYNFKKLLKRENFSGHINYSAPELILEKESFSSKVDVWALGCCLYYMLVKKDPFDGKDPTEIKQNILKLAFEQGQNINIPLVFKPLIEACFIIDENMRPDASQLIELIDQVHSQLKAQKQQFSQLVKQDSNEQQRIHDSIKNHTLKSPKNQKISKSNTNNINQTNNFQMFNQNMLQNNQQLTTELLTIPQNRQNNSSDINSSNCTDDTISSNQSSSQASDVFHPRNIHSDNECKKEEQLSQSCDDKKIHFDAEGNIYEGEYKCGKKHGQGKQIFINGDVYTGSWENGKMHGKGKLVFNSGDIYTGQFMNNMKHGEGVLQFTSGDSYVGDWKNDKMTGKGKYNHVEEQKVYEGDFVEGSPYGFGVMSCQNFFYKGYFKSGLFEGRGKLEDFANYIIFEGEYFDGKRKGFGILHDLKTGDIYQGMWNDDMRDGKGKLISVKENQIIEGIWKQDQLIQVLASTKMDMKKSEQESNSNVKCQQ